MIEVLIYIIVSALQSPFQRALFHYWFVTFALLYLRGSVTRHSIIRSTCKTCSHKKVVYYTQRAYTKVGAQLRWQPKLWQVYWLAETLFKHCLIWTMDIVRAAMTAFMDIFWSKLIPGALPEATYFRFQPISNKPISHKTFKRIKPTQWLTILHRDEKKTGYKMCIKKRMQKTWLEQFNCTFNYCVMQNRRMIIWVRLNARGKHDSWHAWQTLHDLHTQ